MATGTLREILSGNRRVWLRAFWRFSPEQDGYLGFTREVHRDRLIDEYRPGDLVLIYGADTEQTGREERRQVLGFLEIEPIPISDKDRSSPEGYRRKVENGWQDRWTFAVPVKRAWRINRKVEVSHIAARTYGVQKARQIGSRGELLDGGEAEAALRLPVTRTHVFGGESVPADELVGEIAMRDFFEPSPGFPPTYGARSYEVEDGENRLYVLKLLGDVAAFLGRPKFEVARKSVVKVGHAKDPQERCDTHNGHLPPACQFKWQVAYSSKPFPTGAAAKEAEDGLKRHFATRFQSLGREFFLGSEDAVQSEFARVVEEQAFLIRGSTKSTE